MVQTDEAEIVLLIGSQKGKTEVFAHSLKDALIAAKQKVTLCTLNNYNFFPQMKQLIVMTSTYGKGVAPTNADKFLKLLHDINNSPNIVFSVLGFGSTKYLKYCQFAKDVDSALLAHKNFSQLIKPTFVDRNNYSTFLNWTEQWSIANNIKLKITGKNKEFKPKDYRFKVKKFYIERVDISPIVYIELATKKHKKIKKGDWLSFSFENKERHYSVEKLRNKNVLLALNTRKTAIDLKRIGKLKKNKKVKVRHICNTHFQLLSEGMAYSPSKSHSIKEISLPKLLNKLR